MKRYFFTALIALLIPASTFPCINGETIELGNGATLAIDAANTIFPAGHRYFEGNFVENQRDLLRIWKQTRKTEYISDFAMILILQGKYKAAETIYLNIEKLNPGRYSTASNLGTLYELQGKNEKALAWIRKAISINPNSHKGSEWIHANILRAKIKGDQYITSEYLLGTQFGSGETPVSDWPESRLLRLRDALYYQLNERVSLISPPDKIVGVLLFQLGNIAWLTDAKPEAVLTYNKAVSYGRNDALLMKRLRKIRTFVTDEDLKSIF